ncbi:MAG: hypothetical protein AAGM22_12675 [Acidobacteriota bacterium]
MDHQSRHNRITVLGAAGLGLLAVLAHPASHELAGPSLDPASLFFLVSTFVIGSGFGLALILLARSALRSIPNVSGLRLAGHLAFSSVVGVVVFAVAFVFAVMGTGSGVGLAAFGLIGLAQLIAFAVGAMAFLGSLALGLAGASRPA